MRCRTHPDHAIFLDHGEFAQAARRLVDPRERAFIRTCQQCSVETIAPAVIRAAQIARAFAGTVDQPGASVAAHIEEGAKRAVRLTDEKQRYAGIVVGEMIARSRKQTAEADEERSALEEDLALTSELARARVVDHGVSVTAVGHRGGAGLQISEQLAGL